MIKESKMPMILSSLIKLSVVSSKKKVRLEKAKTASTSKVPLTKACKKELAKGLSA